jgi:hypothetical protein
MENTKQQEAAGETVDPRFPDTPIGIVRSRDAFLRDLPALLANPKYDRWSVAYCGNERIAMAASQIDVLRACQRRGLHPDQYYVGGVFPQDLEEEEIEFGLAEFEDGEDQNPGDVKPTP